MENIGLSIKLLRQTYSLKQKDLAKVTGLSIAYISEIENDHAIPSIAALSKIAKALDIKLSEIMLISEWYSNPQLINQSDAIKSIIHPKILAMMEIVSTI